MRILIFCIALFLLASCHKDIELDQPAYEPKVVVDGYIEQDRTAYVFLTQSSPFLTDYDSASIVNSFLNYGKVTLTSSDGEEEILTLIRQDQFFPPFVYRSKKIKGKIGVSYRLEIKIKGKELTATTTIPEQPEIKSVRFKTDIDTLGYVEYLVDRKNQETIHLFSQIRSLKVDQTFHPSGNPMYSYNDNFTGEKWVTVWRSRESQMYLDKLEDYYYNNDYPHYQYSDSDTIWLKIGAVDQTSFDVLSSMFLDLANRENPFAFNGSGIVTNIEGGIGRWTGISTAPIVWVCGQTQPVVDISHFTSSLRDTQARRDTQK